MRIALISDTHGNLPALEAVLEDIRSQGADQIIFLGDSATIGPHPKETLDLLQALNCVCILGNHDAALLEPAQAAEFQIAASLLPTLEWGLGLLSETNITFLRTFHPTHEVKLDGALNLLCFHGSPRSNTELILSTTPDGTLDGAFSGTICKHPGGRTYAHPDVSSARGTGHHQSRQRGKRLCSTFHLRRGVAKIITLG